MMRQRLPIALAALLCLAGFAALLARSPPTFLLLQERVFDAVLRLASAKATPRVQVIDIAEVDDQGLPWGRAATARLLAALATAGPQVVALDIVFSSDCGPGPANDALAHAIGQNPTVLGFLMSARTTLPLRPGPRLAVSGTPTLWEAAGAEGPCTGFADAAAGLGVTALLADADGLVRRIPAAVRAAGVVHPSLALEAVRLAQPGAASPVLAAAAQGNRLRVGSAIFATDAAAQLRFAPSQPQVWAARTSDAASLLAPDADLSRFQGAVVFIGSSLPQRGGLRATASSPIAPSVQIQADLAQGLLTGHLPQRTAAAPLWEAAAATTLGLASIALLLLAPVGAGVGAALGLGAVWALGTALWFATTGSLLDPVTPLLAALIAGAIALVGRANSSARAERTLRRKLAQLLPAAVVRQLADDPRRFHLRGERREITALMTDIEGFSETTRAIGPEALVALLDQYFATTCAIVLRHGGMIDKMVGDSVHALFNAPLDQPGHVDAALACAAELLRETEALRQRPQMQAAGLGRTRIGMETGMAVLGDVGSGLRIDYTAHGDAVNLSARLEAMNKSLGTSLCIGPNAAAQAQGPLRSLGTHQVRSFGMMELFTLPDEGVSPFT
ncbi:adenylate/guanylate cyclase domain-containing protein [Pseudorhodobacter sp. E13]|nr:adenylate/guanylate cyclase domain-containing protein [Pseudorhodobacter sp. E13]